MIYSELRLPISAGSRVNVELIFDGRADDARLAAASDALCAWITGGPLTLPDGVRLASIPLPVLHASAP
jgi:hypothetical protein